MTTESLKKKLITAISQEEDKGVLEFISAVLKEHTSGRRTSKKQYNKELNDAMKRMDDGHFLTQEQVDKLAKKW